MRVSGRWDLNPRHPPWEGGVLPLNYSRTIKQIINEKSSGVKCRSGSSSSLGSERRIMYQTAQNQFSS
jgi:hypothetical protein